MKKEIAKVTAFVSKVAANMGHGLLTHKRLQTTDVLCYTVINLILALFNQCVRIQRVSICSTL